MAGKSVNFGFLVPIDPGLDLLAAQAERLFPIDPPSCLTKLRLLGELLAQEVAARHALYVGTADSQVDVLRRLREAGALPREIGDLFHSLRKAGNAAAHSNAGSQSEALAQMRMAHRASVWTRNLLLGAFKSPPFIPPVAPHDATAELRAEIEAARREAATHKEAADAARLLAEEEAKRRAGAQREAEAARRDIVAYEALLAEAAAAEPQRRERLAAEQLRASSVPPPSSEEIAARAEIAAAQVPEPTERETRLLIDQQLREAGWEVDTRSLSYAAGVRPQRGKNLAIAEWPTASGPADYVLFLGLDAVAVVEAKRKGRDVPASLEQAKRYSRGFETAEGVTIPGGPWGDYRIPFLFATNGRPYLKQLEQKSGIWFRDARRSKNASRALNGWPTPAGLRDLFDRDIDVAHQKLSTEPTDYLHLRDYQLRAITSAEKAIEAGQREILLAMATGTGKTRTCIGLCYRLLKTDRFRRILFLVDRESLGDQAANAFKDARLENLQTFSDIYDIKELADAVPDSDTRVHFATVQGLVRRILFNDDDIPAVDQYDCIIVDECHRGYILDRELSDAELTFRNDSDYISKYRRVLEHFDAVKIGLTATPALQTVEIFGKPVYEYKYREAVIDGFLVDHEPPIRITTGLAEDGIHWKVGESVETYSPVTGELQQSLLPDEVHVEVEQFNKRVLAEGYNRAVCDYLAKQIDPDGVEKTLIFCVTDAHADMVVQILKDSFRAVYGEVDDDAVLKITGTADKPLQLIRRFKNERAPSVVVTVDLLTTGIDIPAICNLVFLRRVRSRILYEQMIGRGTRLCEAIGKEAFRIYDAVDLYSALAPYTDMKPVVPNPGISFTQLIDEMTKVKDSRGRGEVLDQFVAKLTRKRHRLSDEAIEKFETASGMAPDAFLTFLRDNGPSVASEWFAEHPTLGEILDQTTGAADAPLLISHHQDEIRRIERGYGKATKPDDYLEGFAKYLRENMNRMPALLAVTQRPKDLTRKQLKEIKLALDLAGYTELNLQTAWKQKTNQDIAASILGHIRRAALGDALIPYGQRVDRALAKVLASQEWTAPQKKWLERIGKQLHQETVVDREALDQGEFKAQAGGFDRLNKVFEGRLEAILGEFSDAVWRDAG